MIGVGIGERRKGDQTHQGEAALIIYVKSKLTAAEVNNDYLIPPEIRNIATDVVAPFSPASPREALGFFEGHQHSDDMSYIDWPRLHAQWTAAEGADAPARGRVQDFGDVCVIQDDGTLVQTVNGQQVVDFVRAYQLFRTTHPDIYEFVTFFTDTASGMPAQGGSSWYRFVFNDTRGIGFGDFDQRSGYGSKVLEGIIFLNQGHFPRWRHVMLQEQAHRWAAFARYKDSATGPNQSDHMLVGWGHWAPNFDDDTSPMDYDIYDWVGNGPDFGRISLDSEQRTFCNLDLYSASKKLLDVQNVIWAEGPRAPGVATSPKRFKNAFVVLSGDMSSVYDLVDQVDGLRRRFERDFYDASRTLGPVDTVLGPRKAELTPAQVRQLTSGGHTSLHRHQVGRDSGSRAPR